MFICIISKLKSPLFGEPLIRILKKDYTLVRRSKDIYTLLNTVARYAVKYVLQSQGYYDW